MAPAPTLLDREVYEESLAAQLLGVAPSTLHWWLDGRTEPDGHQYDPVLRVEPTGSRIVTWGEFVEARYVKEYRRKHGVKLQRLREFISYMRRELAVPYPLAHARPWVGPNRHLFVVAQNETHLPVDLWGMVEEPQSGVRLLLPAAQSFLERVEFDDQDTGIVVRLRPDGSKSPVVIDPEVRFGSPSVRGIPTQAIAEQVSGGDAIETVSEDFDLPLKDVIAALAYEDNESAKVA